jgi:hypothetical protein
MFNPEVARRHTLVAAIVLTTTVGTLWAQNRSIAPNQNALFLLADQTAALQMALDEAASSGLSVVFGSNQGIYFRRDATKQSAYRPVAHKRTEDFERALNGAGQQGFRAMPETLTISGYDAPVIMRRARDAGSSPIRYRVLASDDKLDKNLSDAAAKGFLPIGVFTRQSGMAEMLGRPGRMYVVLEALSGGAAANASMATGSRYRRLSALRPSTLEKELNEVAADGYRVKGGSLMNVLVEKGELPAKYSYRVIGAIRGATIQDEIRQAGREGFRVLTAAIMHNPSAKLEIVFLMERSATGAHSYEYALLDPTHTADMLDDCGAVDSLPSRWCYMGATSCFLKERDDSQKPGKGSRLSHFSSCRLPVTNVLAQPHTEPLQIGNRLDHSIKHPG